MTFDWTKPTAILIGRYQPPHKGHLELVKESLKRTDQVCILIRHMPQSDSNPFESVTVLDMWQALLSEHQLHDRCVVMVVPNVSHVFYGRDVGYKIEYLELPPEIQAISATKIREEMSK